MDTIKEQLDTLKNISQTLINNLLESYEEVTELHKDYIALRRENQALETLLDETKQCSMLSTCILLITNIVTIGLLIWRW